VTDEPHDPRRIIAERLYAAVCDALRAGGDSALCEALALLAESTGEMRYRHAAGLVGGKRPGRFPIDDREALLRLQGFPPERRREAIAVVAREMAGEGANADAIARRLRRKRQK
jgi:hypothetical protein